MQTGREWRSHRRRDLKYFGDPKDYWPKRMTQSGSFGPIWGVDPSIFDNIQSDPGIELDSGLGLFWQWIVATDFQLFLIEFQWDFPSGPTIDHGGLTVHFLDIFSSDELFIFAQVDDCVLHDGV